MQDVEKKKKTSTILVTECTSEDRRRSFADGFSCRDWSLGEAFGYGSYMSSPLFNLLPLGRPHGEHSAASIVDWDSLLASHLPQFHLHFYYFNVTLRLNVVNPSTLISAVLLPIIFFVMYL